jgi:hypothetical protein
VALYCDVPLFHHENAAGILVLGKRVADER